MGFEPTCPLLAGKTLSRRPRYDRFGTSPRKVEWSKVDGQELGLRTAEILRRPDQIGTPQDDSTMASLRNPLSPSSPATEKVAQNPCAFFGQHAGNNLNLMINFGVVEDGEG